MAENCCENYRQEIYVRAAISRANPANPFPFLLFFFFWPDSLVRQLKWNERREVEKVENEMKRNVMESFTVRISCTSTRPASDTVAVDRTSPPGYLQDIRLVWGQWLGVWGCGAVGGGETVQQFLIHMFRSTRFWFWFCFLSKSLRPRWFMMHARDSPKMKVLSTNLRMAHVAIRPAGVTRDEGWYYKEFKNNIYIYIFILYFLNKIFRNILVQFLTTTVLNNK